MRLNRYLIVLSLAVLPVTSIAEVEKPSWFEERAIKKVVREKLNDPESARFKNILVDKEEASFCAEVNFKTIFGGYGGYKPVVGGFIEIEGIEDVITVIGIGDNNRDAQEIRVVCKRIGLM